MEQITPERIAQVLADGIMNAYMVAKDNYGNPNFPEDYKAFPLVLAMLYVDLQLTNIITREQLDKAILKNYGPMALRYAEIARTETLKKMKETGIYDSTPATK